MSRTYAIRAVQQLPVSVEEAWAYFSNPRNLAQITPPQLDFQMIGTQGEDPIHAGQIIQYKLRPLAGIPMYWMTEITHVQPLQYFVDEQRFGPYSFWHHQHHFVPNGSGVQMTDHVHYRIPLGFLGNWVNSLLVSRELQKLFAFRHQKVEQIFGRASVQHDDQPAIVFA